MWDCEGALKMGETRGGRKDTKVEDQLEQSFCSNTCLGSFLHLLEPVCIPIAVTMNLRRRIFEKLPRFPVFPRIALGCCF
jgi:hypothetical protein